MGGTARSNAEAAEQLRRIADLLDVLGERFKPEAYRRAARSIESLPEELARVAGRGELESIPGVGTAIAEKLREYLAAGSIPYLARLETEVPAGVVELVRLPGLGPKTARRFWTELGVDGPAELEAAITAGRLNGVKGFGDRKVELLRTALATRATAGGARRPIETVVPIARGLVAALRSGAPTEQVEIAGSYRRGRETVGDLDLLVTSAQPEHVFDVFSALPQIAEVKMRGGTKETVLLQGGLQVDLRVVEPAAFGAALQYFTGSKDHNVRLRSLARDGGLKVNEYGVFRGEERVAGATEEEVYRSLGLHWIPPELREDRGEIDAARAGPLPTLVAATDLKGDLHAHLPAGAGAREVERLVAAARAGPLTYVGVVVAEVAPDGTTTAVDPAVVRAIEGTRGEPVELWPVVESGPGPLPTGEGLPTARYRVVRADGPVSENARGPTRDPRIRVVAHRADGGPDGAAWTDFARSVGAAVEVGPGRGRVDSTVARAAREAGVSLAVPTGLGAGDDEVVRDVSLGFARRAGATPAEVANTRVADPPTRGGRRTPR